jgi:hypothetical protein
VAFPHIGGHIFKIIYSHRIKRKIHRMLIRDPKRGAKRSMWLPVKRNKMVNVAATSSHTLGRRKIKQEWYKRLN